MRSKLMILGLILALVALSGCNSIPSGEAEDDSDAQDAGADGQGPNVFTAMEGDTADCEFDVVTFSVDGGTPQEVHINGLPVEALSGAEKVVEDQWGVISRRGVRFSDILDKAGLSVPDDEPVNCVARDGYDPLRTRLEGDTSLLPTFAFFRDHGYVYVGSPGDKDPLYPEMEGRSLIVDYDLTGDSDVPDYLGGELGALGLFRWKMVEKLDDQQRGVFEIAPVVE